MKYTIICGCVLSILLCGCSANTDRSEYENSTEYTASASSAVQKEASDTDSQEDSLSDSTNDTWLSFEQTYSQRDDSVKSRNYETNSKLWTNRLLQGKLIESGQALEPQSQFVLGEYYFSHNGCEVIAAYNFLTLNGIDTDLPKLAYEFEVNALVSQDGAMGSKPSSIELLITERGLDCQKLLSTEECDNALSQGKACILSFWTGTPYLSSIHTVAIIGGEDFYVLNRYNTANGKSQIASTSDLATTSQHFITAFTLK